MNDATRRLRAGLSLALAAAALAAPLAARAAECAGDECQPPPPAPAEVTPGTAVVEGPENPPVHFPKPHHAKKPPHRKPATGKHHKPSSHRGASR